MAGLGVVLQQVPGWLGEQRRIEILGALEVYGGDGRCSWFDSLIGLFHAHRWITPEEVGETQPVSNEAGYHLVADARIDNRDELRVRLASRLEPNRPTDAQLILAAYDLWGTDCASHLLGDFAFAIWDARRKRLFAARDPIGLRPLYYSKPSGAVVVASSLDAVLAALPSLPPENIEFIRDYLNGDFRRWVGETIRKGVYRLPPGHRLVADRESCNVSQYYELGSASLPKLESEAAYGARFAELLKESVRARLRCVGPVGMMVSGGLDSSAIACQADELVTEGRAGVPLYSYSSVFARTASADEKAYFDIVTAHCRNVAPRLIWSDDLDGIPDIDSECISREEPVGVPYRLVMGRIGLAQQDGCRAVLSGAMADQVLASGCYSNIVALRDVPLFRWSSELPYFTGTSGRTNLGVILGAYGAQIARRARQLKSPAVIRRGHLSHTGRAVLSSIRGFSVDAAQVARLSAICGVEWRLPFLDRRLVEFLLAVPPEFLFQDGQTKRLLRRSPIPLPSAIRSRTTMATFQSLLWRLPQDVGGRIGSESYVVKKGYARTEDIERLLTDFGRERTIRRWRRLKTLIAIERWFRQNDVSRKVS